MKILHIMPTLGFGGISIMMQLYASELQNQGVTFDYIHHGKREEFHSVLEEHGSKIFSLPNLSVCGQKKYSELVQNIVATNGPYDAVHIHMNYLSGRFARIARKIGIEKRIIHVHGVNFYKQYTKYLMPIIRYDILHNGNRFFADSVQSGKYYFRGKAFEVIPVAIDMKKYRGIISARARMRQQLLLNESDFAIGHIAAFYEVKNHKFDVQLLKQLNSNEPQKKYVMFFAGDGPLRESIRKEFDDEGLKDNVVFLGNIDYVPEFISAMDVTILPSISEGLGQVLIQSQACSVPFIASDTLPRESDMHMGLAHYLPIGNDNSADVWADEIKTLQPLNYTEIECKEFIDKACYSTEAAAARLLELYSRE